VRPKSEVQREAEHVDDAATGRPRDMTLENMVRWMMGGRGLHASMVL